ncbi:MAG: hypothetical protein LBG20_00550 [Holosporaceae bacterium]|nr:hypothetical protein [Holosporaceae bacterium]
MWFFRKVAIGLFFLLGISDSIAIRTHPRDHAAGTKPSAVSQRKGKSPTPGKATSGKLNKVPSSGHTAQIGPNRSAEKDRKTMPNANHIDHTDFSIVTRSKVRSLKHGMKSTPPRLSFDIPIGEIIFDDNTDQNSDSPGNSSVAEDEEDSDTVASESSKTPPPRSRKGKTAKNHGESSPGSKLNIDVPVGDIVFNTEDSESDSSGNSADDVSGMAMPPQQPGIPPLVQPMMGQPLPQNAGGALMAPPPFSPADGMPQAGMTLQQPIPMQQGFPLPAAMPLPSEPEPEDEPEDESGEKDGEESTENPPAEQPYVIAPQPSIVQSEEIRQIRATLSEQNALLQQIMQNLNTAELRSQSSVDNRPTEEELAEEATARIRRIHQELNEIRDLIPPAGDLQKEEEEEVVETTLDHLRRRGLLNEGRMEMLGSLQSLVGRCDRCEDNDEQPLFSIGKVKLCHYHLKKAVKGFERMDGDEFETFTSRSKSRRAHGRNERGDDDEGGVLDALGKGLEEGLEEGVKKGIKKLVAGEDKSTQTATTSGQMVLGPDGKLIPASSLPLPGAPYGYKLDPVTGRMVPATSLQEGIASANAAPNGCIMGADGRMRAATPQEAALQAQQGTIPQGQMVLGPDGKLIPASSLPLPGAPYGYKLDPVTGRMVPATSLQEGIASANAAPGGYVMGPTGKMVPAASSQGMISSLAQNSPLSGVFNTASSLAQLGSTAMSLFNKKGTTTGTAASPSGIPGVPVSGYAGQPGTLGVLPPGSAYGQPQGGVSPNQIAAQKQQLQVDLSDLQRQLQEAQQKLSTTSGFIAKHRAENAVKKLQKKIAEKQKAIDAANAQAQQAQVPH